MAYYCLLSGRLYVKKIRKLNNLPKTFKTEFYKNKIGSIDSTFDSNLKMTLKNFTKTKLRKKKYFKRWTLKWRRKKLKLEFNPEIVDEDTVEFVGKVPLHPRERSRRKF